MLQEQLVTLKQAIEEIVPTLKRLHGHMVKASQGEEADNIMFAFSPEEWERIAITINHWGRFIKIWNSLDDKGKTEYIDENCAFLGYIRDMAMAFKAQLEEVETGRSEA